MNLVGASVSVRETSGNGRRQCSDSKRAKWEVSSVQLSVLELNSEREAASELTPQKL